MKKLILIIFTIVSINAVAQTQLIGIKGGLNQTNVTNEFKDNVLNRTGFSIGATYEYLFKKTFSFGADLVYSQRGYKTSFEAWDVFTTNSRYNYISLPLKIGVYGENKLFCFVNGGIVPSILISAKEVNSAYYIGRSEKNTTTSENITKSTNKIDLAGLFEFGLGYRFKKKYWVYSSFMYQASYIPIAVRNSNYADANRLYSRTISLGVKYDWKK